MSPKLSLNQIKSIAEQWASWVNHQYSSGMSIASFQNADSGERVQGHLDPNIWYANDDIRAFSEAIEKVDDKHSSIIIFHYICGKSLSDIGAMLRYPAATVKQRISRAQYRVDTDLEKIGEYL